MTATFTPNPVSRASPPFAPFLLPLTHSLPSLPQALHRETNKRDWAYQIGCMPLTDHIVFTKASLLDFLKTKGAEVGPNFAELNRLPM